MKTILWCVKVGIAGCLALLLLSEVANVYNYTGVHIKNASGATDYTWEPNQLKSNLTEGFARFRMDSHGFNNIKPIEDKAVDILLMGSSHMEAVQINPKDNTAAQLNRFLPGMYTYNIGMSGHQIYNNVNNMSDAVSVYQPTKYVILEINSIELSVDDMQKVSGGGYPRIPSYDSGLLYLIQKKIPAVKCIYKQLEDWRAASGNSSVDNPSEEVVYASETTVYKSREYLDTLDRFLQKAVSAVQTQGIDLIILYHPMMELKSSGKLHNTTDPDAMEAFSEACENNGIIFIDMAEDYEELYEREHRLPYGFSNTAVGRGHLNKYGHRTIAKRLAEVILSQQK